MMKSLEKYKSLPVQAKASFWFLLCSFLQKGISMLATPIFTRIMSTDDYGRFGVFVSWYGIITIIVALALTGGVHTQGLIKFDNQRSAFSASLQGMSLTLISFWILVYFAFRSFWNSLFSLSSVQMLCMFVIIWSNAAFGLWANEQRVMYSYKLLVFVALVSSVAKTVLEIVFVLCADDKATARIVAWAVVDFLSFGWMFVSQIIKGRLFFSKKFWLYALKFNLPLVPHYLSQTVLSSADRIMIEKMIGDSESGIYNLAYSLAIVMALFNASLMQALSPWIYQKIKDKKNKDIANVAYITLFIVAGANLLLILLAPEAVALFAPKAYNAAVYVVPPVAMSVYFMYAYDLFAKIAFYYEKTMAIMTASVFAAVFNIILNFGFIKAFGYIAAGYTTLMCYIIYAIVHYAFMRKVCRECCDGVYPYDTKKVVLISVMFLAGGFALLATYRYTMLRCGLLLALLTCMALVVKKHAHQLLGDFRSC